MFGVPKMFTPIWSHWPPWSYDEDYNNSNGIFYHRDKGEHQEHYYDFLNPINWTYFYDHSALAKTLDKYIDYKKTQPCCNKRRITRGTSTYNNCCRCDDSQTTYI